VLLADSAKYGICCFQLPVTISLGLPTGLSMPFVTFFIALQLLAKSGTFCRIEKIIVL
jgi:hypothetical protein